MSNRQAIGLAAAGGLLALGIVAAIEYLGIMQPCALCWTQRLIMALFTLILIIGLVLWPQGKVGKFTLAAATMATACAGAGVALRHLYVIWNPHVVECGMSPEMMLSMLPLHEIVVAFVTGSSDCTQADPLLGIPLPLWSLASFIGLGALAGYALLRRPTNELND